MCFWYFDMKRWTPIVVLITLWFVFFWRQILGGEVWYCCDNLLINIPARVFQAQELTHWRFPLWNPYIFSGTPFFADINLAVLHPLNLLYLILPPFRALTVGILVLFFVGSLGMYVLGRTLRLGRFGSLVGAIVFGLSGSLVVYTNNIPILQVAVLVPWVLAFWIRYLEKPTGKQLVAFVLMAAFQFFSGHPQFTYYTWLILVAFALYQKPAFKTLKLGFKAALMVALVSSVQAIPFLEFMRFSTRMVRDFAYVTLDSVHPLSLIRLIIPGIVGDLSRGTAWIQAGSIHGYVGILPLLLLPFALRTRVGRFFIAVAIFSILMGLGKYTPVFWLAYHVIPGIAWFREPVQFLFLWVFGVASATMVAADTLAKKPQNPRYILFTGLGIMLGAAVFRVQGVGIWEQVVRFGMLSDRLMLKLSALPWSQRTIIMEGLLYNLTLAGSLAVLAALAIGRLRSSLVAKVIVLGVLSVDLFVYGQTNVTTVHESVARGWQEETRVRITSWKLSDTDNYRYYTDPAVYPYPGKKQFGQFNDPGESAWQLRILRPTIGMLYGLSAVDGYASMVLSSYQRWFGASGRDPTGVAIPSIVDPRLAIAGVRYLITKPNNPLLADTKQYRFLTADEKLAIYEDRKAVPRVAKSIDLSPGASIIGGLLTLVGLAWCLGLGLQKKPNNEQSIDDA